MAIETPVGEANQQTSDKDKAPTGDSSNFARSICEGEKGFDEQKKPSHTRQGRQFPGCPPLPIQQSSSYTLEGGSIDETCLTFFASWFSNTRFVKTAGNFPLHFDVPVLRRELFRLTHCWARAAGCSVHCGSCSLRWRQQPRCQWSLTVGRSWGRCGEAFYTLSKEECLV